MKILIVNTSDLVGGAAIAAQRLMKALKAEGADVQMLVLNAKSVDSPDVASLPNKWAKRLAFLYERIVIWVNNHFSRQNLFAVSIANTGFDITALPQFQQADVIHLHWINQGFLSLGNLTKIMQSGKKIVWTMHDMWAFTGICHYAGNCMKYRTWCDFCPMLTMSSQHDLSSKVFQLKQKLFQYPLTIIGCSQWIANLAKESLLLRNQNILSIPNPIDTELFRPLNSKSQLKAKFGLPNDKFLFLFCSQKVTDSRKGMNYLFEALEYLAKNYPDETSRIGLVVLGGKATSLSSLNSRPSSLVSRLSIKLMPYISSPNDMAEIYNAVDAFITPSLQDNLPNTIMESLSCGLPCIGFNVGGIPEMIDHLQNGYVASCESSVDLAKGMLWLISHPDYKSISDSARSKVLENYSPHIVAQRMLKVYNA